MAGFTYLSFNFEFFTAMTNAIQQAIESRMSVNHFEPNRPLSDDVINALIAQAARAPSAYNMQN